MNSFVCSERFNVAELKHIENYSKTLEQVKKFLKENGIEEERAEQASKEQEETLTERLVRIRKHLRKGLQRKQGGLIFI